MKRSLFAAGIGAAGVMGAVVVAAPAQAACEATPPLTPVRVECVVNENLSTFKNTTDPAYNLDQLLNSGQDSNGNNVGLRNWGSTFQSSVGDFLNGPRAPEDPTAP